MMMGEIPSMELVSAPMVLLGAAACDPSETSWNGGGPRVRDGWRLTWLYQRQDEATGDTRCQARAMSLDVWLGDAPARAPNLR